MSNSYSAEDLALVFGADSQGATPLDRARTSRHCFVRSQVQLAPASEGARGRLLTAFEAVEAFGWDTVRKSALEGVAPLITSPDEPSASLRKRREDLGLTTAALAKRSGLSEAVVVKAEKPGELSPVRDLDRLGQSLALDERLLGFVSNPGRDRGLGVRLRELSNQSDVTGFGPATVLGLAEAAWVVARQSALQKMLGDDNPSDILLPRHDPNYGYPAHQVGYALAAKTRVLLGLEETSPIESLRTLIEDRLGLPLVQQSLDPRFAGATIANGRVRGIVVNERGLNANVWIRRMTMCHELGHLLWDPDEKLSKLQVDEYSELDADYRTSRRDPAEIRANAFAVAFLAPPSAVQRIAKELGDPHETVLRVITTFGISGTAAKYHVQNATGMDTSRVGSASWPEPDPSWIASENLTIDFFPLEPTPITRRGRFSWFVAKLCAQGLITEDSAAMQLRVRPEDIREALPRILALWPDR